MLPSHMYIVVIGRWHTAPKHSQIVIHLVLANVSDLMRTGSTWFYHIYERWSAVMIYNWMCCDQRTLNYNVHDLRMSCMFNTWFWHLKTFLTNTNFFFSQNLVKKLLQNSLSRDCFAWEENINYLKAEHFEKKKTLPQW